MKYIRTKYGVYEIIEEDLTMYYCNDNNRCLDKIHNLIIFDAHRKDEIIAESNTIEKLCDEFVLVLDYSKIGKNNEHIIIKNKDLKYSKLLTNVIKNSTIYGAIYTDKGLIYVAKMNDKGDLELI